MAARGPGVRRPPVTEAIAPTILAFGRLTSWTIDGTLMSLISFHRFLIATAILFCFGFAIWELMTWRVGGESGALMLGGTFIALGGVLTYYLVRLRHFLGLDAGFSGDHPSRIR